MESVEREYNQTLLVHGVSEMGPSEVQWHKRQFECKRCRGEVPQVDSAEQEVLIVDRETHGVVDNFCYLGDMLNADVGVLHHEGGA